MSPKSPTASLPWGPGTCRAELIARINRYTAQVLLKGEVTYAFLPNTGRLQELMTPGHPALLRPAKNPERRTCWDFVAVEHNGVWVSVDTGIPNRLTAAGLETGVLPWGNVFKREAKLGDSRLDFRIDMPAQTPYWLEVKSCTLVVKGTGLFPDAPSERATRHLHHLMDRVAAGERAGALFMIQRDDAERFSPNAPMDPLFASTLREALARGVEVHAWICKVSPKEVRLIKAVPVIPDFEATGLCRKDLPCR